MGQYHILVNLNKKQFVHPSGFGLGSKQAEHFFGGKISLGQVMYLLTCVPVGRGGGDIIEDGNYLFIGSWLGDRIAVVGDYSVDEDLPNYPNFGSVYGECAARWNPVFDCYGLKKECNDPSNAWRDITGDLAFEVEELLDIKIIPLGHPTLWPDGTAKPDFMIEQTKKAKALLRKGTN